MIPPQDHPCWKELVKGAAICKFKLYAANLNISRHKRMYATEPTPEMMNRCIKELYQFFKKYELLLEEEIHNQLIKP